MRDLINGWVWIVPCLAAGLLTRLFSTGIFIAVVPGLVWFAAFEFTADRRFYFCYTIFYAVQIGCLLRTAKGPLASFAGSAVMIGLFLAIRDSQDASFSVLMVELAVAAVILAICIGIAPKDFKRRAALAAAGSLLAFAGLAL